ncbi:TetR/AcrR family transcriptional regulator [Caldimonas tepidiphila]|uniref:TetR/AcrR family transcriptional regulator n=1 Tax=Caldimonas tepidiphila TaxID=2315841 RepID=UPI000E5A33C2|nr:TetR/AcrR family transcriptional regulator [Caldimonas tepidiphila]
MNNDLLPPQDPPAPRRRRKEARPQELLDAALDLFVEKGFAATRAEEVAARAGVSKGTLYLYYPSKEELLKAVVRQNVASKIAEGMALVDCFEGSASELLALVLRGWWERIGETKASGILKLMMAEVGNFPDLAQFYLREVIEPSHALLQRVLRMGVERGEFRATDPEYTVHALVAPMLFVSMQMHSIGPCMGTERQIDPCRFVEVQIDLMLRGLRGDAPPLTLSACSPPACA